MQIKSTANAKLRTTSAQNNLSALPFSFAIFSLSLSVA